MKKYYSLLFTFIFFISANITTAQSLRDSLLVDVTAEKLQKIIHSFEGKKAVLVNVWATWCIPCVEEFPVIVKIQKMYPEKLQVIFVSVDFPKYRDRVISFLKEHNVDWPTYLSMVQGAEFINALSDDWSGAVPFTKIINKNSDVVASWENKADFATFNRYVKQAINL